MLWGYGGDGFFGGRWRWRWEGEERERVVVVVGGGGEVWPWATGLDLFRYVCPIDLFRYGRRFHALYLLART